MDSLLATTIKGMQGDRAAWTALSFYLVRAGLVRRIEPLGSGGGWSGSRLWRVECTDGRLLCLRRWPEGHPSAERLRFIHGVLARVWAKGPTIIPVPLPTDQDQTFVEFEGYFWELTPWLAGEADFHRHPTPGRLKAAMESLARFHDYAALGDAPREQAPCLVDREAELVALRRGQLAEIETALRSGIRTELDSRGQRIIVAARGRLADLEALVRVAVRQKLPLQPAIRDIHHEHVLFEGDEVSGIIDFGAMRMDSPLTDVARLVGSLIGDDVESRRLALDAYAAMRPLTDADRQLIDLLDESGLVLGGLHWLKWLYVERREMGEQTPIIRRLDELLTRLEGRVPRLVF